MTGHARADRWLLATLGAITTVTAVVSSLGAPLVPSIAESYDVPVGTAQWILTATMICAAVTTPVLGRWATGRHRRPAILLGLGLVMAGAVLSALPTSLAGVIIGRTLQGIGLALAPLALAVARDVWTGPELAARLSPLSVATVAGAGLGYPLTALLAEHLGVAGAYSFGAVLVAAALVLAVRHLPRATAGAPQRVDVVGAGLLSLGMVGALLAVSQGEQWGWISARTLGLGFGGLALVALWIGRTVLMTRSGGQPLVDLRLAARPGVLGPNAVAFALALAMYGLLTLVVLLVRADGSAGWGLDAGVTAAGLVLVPYSLLSVTGSRVALRVARRFGSHLLLPTGCAVFASSMALVAFANDHLWQALVAMAIGGLGSGFTFSTLPMLIVPHVPAAETGSAMAFNQLMRYLGFSVGSAASVALLEVYGGHEQAFRATLLTFAAVCAAAGVGVLLGSRWRGAAPTGETLLLDL